MFRKVQLKFFGIITAILLAIFIAVLGSINIIMDTVMEHQTKIVLEQVAAGVEYDSVSGKFFIERPDDINWKRFDDFPRTEPPSEPDEVTSVTSSAAAETTTVTTAETTETETEPQSIEEVTEAPQETAPPEIEPPPPQTTRAPETQAPKTPNTRETDFKPQATTEPRHTTIEPMPTDPLPTPNDDDDDDDDKQKETTPHGQWWGPWPPPPPWWDGGFDHRNGGGAIYGMADNSFVPVLDGYTIICGTDTPRTSEENDFGREPAPPENAGFDRGGSVPRTLGSIDFFIIMADSDGKLLAIQNNDDMSDAVAQEYINEILGEKAASGMANKYQFCTEKKTNGTLMVFTDKSAEIDMMNKLKRTTVIVGLISIIILSAAAYFLSGLIVRPIKEAFDKQKQFISDASHELKTPLTVISANADVLEGEIGENKWLTYIQDQAERMNVLVNDLLNLTRLENNTNFIVSEFDLSKAVANTALAFECRAFETGKNFTLNIEEGIRISGSEQHIKQMVAIFIDNALKYSKENGTVRVSLTNENGKIRFSVYNTGTGLKESEKEKVFERFFRSDASRNRATGGYGLGLAIAKSIIDKHKFKLFVDNAEGKSVCFIVTMN